MQRDRRCEIASGKHLVQVGFMRRYDRGYNQVKELIETGEFGAPLVLKCTHRAESVADDYTTEMAVTDTAIHEIDVLPWLIGGDEWDEVQCIMPKITKNASWRTERSTGYDHENKRRCCLYAGSQCKLWVRI